MQTDTVYSIEALGKRLFTDVQTGNFRQRHKEMLIDCLCAEPFCSLGVSYAAMNDDMEDAQPKPTSTYFADTLKHDDLSGTARANLARAWQLYDAATQADNDAHAPRHHRPDAAISLVG